MIEQVHGWVVEAAQIALRLRHNIETRRKADRSIVTAADTEIETLLRDRIGAAYPAHAILGEEQGGSDLDAEYLWVLDPIDGTSSFAQGLPVWGVSVGLLHQGVPVLGCFYLPVLDEWYEVDLTGPARCNGLPIEVKQTDLQDPESWICVPSNIHRRYHVSYPGKVRVLGSLAAYLCFVARGSAAGALIGWGKVWDIAAALAVLQRAGGDACYLDTGTPVDLRALIRGQSPRAPIIAGSPSAIKMLQAHITVR